MSANYLSGVVKLSGSFKGEKIEIEFDCQAEEQLEPSLEDFEAQQEQDEDAELEPKTGILFSAKIVKGNDAVLIGCTASDVLMINSVEILPNGKEKTDALYGGPVFDQLEEGVQKSFYEYLAERKIDDDLSYFVLSYSRDKEQREYVHWLKSVLSFVEK